MATIDEEILYDKEHKLGLTTFSFRSQRYSVPSVIIKGDTKSEGVCVMLDVGLFCPYCSGGTQTTEYTHKRSRLSIGQKLIKSQIDQQKLEKMLTSQERHKRGHQIAVGSSLPEADGKMSKLPVKKSRLVDKTKLARPDLSALDVIASKANANTAKEGATSPNVETSQAGSTIPFKSRTASFEPQIQACVKSKVDAAPKSHLQSPLKSSIVTEPLLQSCIKSKILTSQDEQHIIQSGHKFGYTHHLQASPRKPYDKGKRAKPKVPPKPSWSADTKQKPLTVPALKDLASDIVTGEHFYPHDTGENTQQEIVEEFNSCEEVAEFENTLKLEKEHENEVEKLGDNTCEDKCLIARNNTNITKPLNSGQHKLVDYKNNHNISSHTLGDQCNLGRKQDQMKQRLNNNSEFTKRNNRGNVRDISIQNMESSEKCVKNASGLQVTNLCIEIPSTTTHRSQNDCLLVKDEQKNNTKHDLVQREDNGKVMGDLCLSKDIGINKQSFIQTQSCDVNMDKAINTKVCNNNQDIKYSVHHQENDIIGYDDKHSHSFTSYHKSDEKLWSRDETTDSDTSSLYKKSAENLLMCQSFDTGSDGYLMDELLTDSVISEESDFKDVDENTLIAIEKKLMQDLASLETQEIVDDKKKFDKGNADAKNSENLQEKLLKNNQVDDIENTAELENGNLVTSDSSMKHDENIYSSDKNITMNVHVSNNNNSITREKPNNKLESTKQDSGKISNVEWNNNINKQNITSSNSKEMKLLPMKSDNRVKVSSSSSSNSKIVENVNPNKQKREKLVKKLPPPVPKKRLIGFEPIGNKVIMNDFSHHRNGMDSKKDGKRINLDNPSSPRERCRSCSPETVMEEILDHLDETETETFSGDATLGRVFSVRREKKYLSVSSDTDSQRHSGTSPVIEEASGDIGEFYNFMKEMQEAETQKQKKVNIEETELKEETRKKLFTVGERDSTEHLFEVEVNATTTTSTNDGDKFGSLNDLLDEEISCAKDLNETFSVAETHQSLSSDQGKDLNQTSTTIGEDSVFNSTLNADEIFESAFENALEDIDNAEPLKDWTSDYESDVRGSNSTSKSASLNRGDINKEDKETSQIYEHYLQSLESPTRFQKKKSSSVECVVGDRSQRGLSEVASIENRTPSRGSYSRGSLSSGCSYTDEEMEESSNQQHQMIKIPFEQVILDTNRLTKDIIDGDNNNNNDSSRRKTRPHLKGIEIDELNIEATHNEVIVNREELFHSPGSICTQKSPSIIVQKPQVLLAKTQKIPLISSSQHDNISKVHTFDSTEGGIDQQNVYVTRDDIMNPNINKYISKEHSVNNQNLHEPNRLQRQPSVDEMSEGSTMSCDEFIPEIEEPNAPPEVLQQAYHAAIQVAQMFQHHHVTHPCFQKILEEISSSRESLLVSDSEGSRTNTLRRNKLAAKQPIKEENEKTETTQSEVIVNKEEKSNGITNEVVSPNMAEQANDIVVSQEQAQQFLQHVMGKDHTKESDKEKQITSIDGPDECHSCVVKADEGTVVKSEVVSTEEVTLIFAWPKSKGKNFIKADPNLPFRQLHMHRVLKSDDMNVQILEGPSLKSITQKMVPNKAIENKSDSREKASGEVVPYNKSETDNDDQENEENEQIIADIDVKVKSTKFTPKGPTVVVERQTKEESDLVESITENIVKVLSEHNTVEYNDPQQLSLESSLSEHLKALPEPESTADDILNNNCTIEDIRLYAETFFDLVYHETIIELNEELKLIEEENISKEVEQLTFTENVQNMSNIDSVLVEHKFKDSKTTHSCEIVKEDISVDQQDGDLMSEIALDILENTSGGALLENSDNIPNTITQFDTTVKNTFAPRAVSAEIINNDNTLHCTNVTLANPHPFSLVTNHKCNNDGDSHLVNPNDFNIPADSVLDSQIEIHGNVSSSVSGKCVQRTETEKSESTAREITSSSNVIKQDETSEAYKRNINVCTLSKMDSMEYSSGTETNDEVALLTSISDLQISESSKQSDLNVQEGSNQQSEIHVDAELTMQNDLKVDSQNAKQNNVSVVVENKVTDSSIQSVEENSAVSYYMQTASGITRTTSDTDVGLKEKVEQINKELDELFPKKRMYSSLQDLDKSQKVKARSKRLSLSETLLENLENEVRKATSQDEINYIIEGCTFAMEESIRTSAEMIMDDSPVEIKSNPAYRITTELISSNEIAVPNKAKTSSTSTLDTIHEGTTFSKKKQQQPPQVKPKPQTPLKEKVMVGPDKSSEELQTEIDLIESIKKLSKLDKSSPEKEMPFQESDQKKVPPPTKPKVTPPRKPKEPPPAKHKEPPPTKPKPQKLIPGTVSNKCSSKTSKTEDEINIDKIGETLFNCQFNTNMHESSSKPIHNNNSSSACQLYERNNLHEFVHNSSSSCSDVRESSIERKLKRELDEFMSVLEVQCPPKVNIHFSPYKERPKVNEQQQESSMHKSEPNLWSPKSNRMQKLLQSESMQFLGCSSEYGTVSFESTEIPEVDMTRYFVPMDINDICKTEIKHPVLEYETKSGPYNQTDDVHVDIVLQEFSTNFAHTIMDNVYQCIEQQYVQYVDEPTVCDIKSKTFNEQEFLDDLYLYSDFLVDNALLCAMDIISVMKSTPKHGENNKDKPSNSNYRSFVSTDNVCKHIKQDNSSKKLNLQSNNKKKHKSNISVQMSQSFHGDNTVTDNFPAVNTVCKLSSSEPLMVWEDDSNSLMWEKTQSVPIFEGESGYKTKIPPLMLQNDSVSTFTEDSQNCSSITWDSVLNSSCSIDRLKESIDSVNSFNSVLSSSNSNNTLVLSSQDDGLSSAGYPESSFSFNYLESISTSQQQLDSSFSTAEDIECDSSSHSTLDDLVEINQAIIQNQMIVEKHEKILESRDYIEKQVYNSQYGEEQSEFTSSEEILDNESKDKSPSLEDELDDFGQEWYSDDEKSDYDNQTVSDINMSSSSFTESQSTVKRHPDYTRRQHKLYQKSLRVEHLRRDSDVSSESSDIDYSEYKTYIPDDLLKTDIDGAEVAQYAISPGFTYRRDNTSTCSGSSVVSSNKLSPFDNVPETAISTSPTVDTKSVVNVSQQIEKLNKALHFDEITKAGKRKPNIGVTEPLTITVPIVNFESALSPQDISAKRPRVLGRSRTWNDINFDRTKLEHHERSLTIIPSRSPTSPSFSPTSASAFNVRDDDYAKRSRMYLRKKAEDVSNILNSNTELNKKLSGMSSDFSDLLDRVGYMRRKLAETRSRSKQLSGEATFINRSIDSVEQGLQLNQNKSSYLELLPRSKSFDTGEKYINTSNNEQDELRDYAFSSENVHVSEAKIKRIPRTSSYSRLEGRGGLLYDKEVASYLSESSPPLPNVFQKQRTGLVRRHSTGDLKLNHKTEDKKYFNTSKTDKNGISGKPPIVPRRGSNSRTTKTKHSN